MAEIVSSDRRGQVANLNASTVCEQNISPVCWSTFCLVRIRGAFEINNIQRGRVTCYMDEIRLT
jgi:hypothetical protein